MKVYAELDRETGYNDFFAMADKHGFNASKIREQITASYTALEGTEKQIKWAEKLRDELRDRNIRWYILHKIQPGFYKETQVEEIFNLIKNWLKKSNVKVFIDFRGTKMLEVAERRVIKGK